MDYKNHLSKSVLDFQKNIFSLANCIRHCTTGGVLRLLSLFFFFLYCNGVNAQNDSVEKKKATAIFLSQPNFSMHKDNYFITGTSFRDGPSTNNSDVKFQISFKYRINQKPLFDNVYSYLTYTQKSFWDVYQKSSPFGDINFNPGLGLIRPYMSKKGRLGYYSLMLEHESNGKDSISSRSWNFISFNWGAEVSPKLIIDAKLTIPYGSLSDNPKLPKYIGYGDLAFTYIFIPQKLYAKVIVKKGADWDWRGSVETQLFFKVIPTSNLYMMLQGFHGYGENLLQYNQQASMIRFGFVLKPNFMNFF